MVEYWNGGLDDFHFCFHYLSCCSFPVESIVVDIRTTLLKSNRSSALHAYIIYPLILHFDKPLCLTIWESSCTKGVQTPTRLGPYTS